MSDTLVVVKWQRYPEDPISTRTFTQPSEAARFVNDKAEDYRYTLGRVWQEEYVRKA